MRQTSAKYGLFEGGGGVVAAVSGGADSVALLYGLLSLKDALSLTVSAAHVNHNLRGADSGADENFVRELCSRLGVGLYVYQADVRGLAALERISIEEAGRRLRYAFLDAALAEAGADKIAVAHTSDDNAETVLLNLTRGAGLAGLCGIPPSRGNIVRPLIETPRSMVEAFLAEQNAPFREDASNADPAYARNRIRSSVLPVIAAETRTNAAAVIARGAALLRDDEAYLTQQAREALELCMCDARTNPTIQEISASKDMSGNTAAEIKLNINSLAALHPALRRRVVREGFRRLCGGVTDLSQTHTEQVLSLLNGQTGRRVELPHTTAARREYDSLVFYKTDGRIPASLPLNVELTPGAPVYIPRIDKFIYISLSPPQNPAENGCTKVFRYDSMTMFLRTRRPGDRIFFEGAGSRKLQDYFTDRKIPAAERDLIPLLAVGGDVLWIIDGKNRVNGRYKPEDGKPSVYVTLTGGI